MTYSTSPAARTLRAGVFGGLALLLAAVGGFGRFGWHVHLHLHRPVRPRQPAYTVVQNRIVDPTGATFAVHGVDRPSLEWSCAGQPVTGSGTGTPATDFTTMRADGANTVRIALNEEFWLSSTDGMPVADPCPTYTATVESAVSAAAEPGWS